MVACERARLRPLFKTAKHRQPAIPQVVAAEDEQVEEPIFIAQNNAPAQPPAPGVDVQGSATGVLPQTGGNSGLELMTWHCHVAGGGLAAAVHALHRKSIA